MPIVGGPEGPIGEAANSPVVCAASTACFGETIAILTVGGPEGPRAEAANSPVVSAASTACFGETIAILTVGGPEGPIGEAVNSHAASAASTDQCTGALACSVDKQSRIFLLKNQKNPIGAVVVAVDTGDMAKISTNTGYRQLRKGRISIPGQIYLITTVCADRRAIFANARRAVATALALREQRLWRDSTALCWVLMPDHLHLMLLLGESESLAHAMNRIKSVTSRAARDGGHDANAVWMPGFHDHALRRDEDVLAAMRYVLANPIRAELVRSLEAYQYWGCVWGSDVLKM